MNPETESAVEASPWIATVPEEDATGELADAYAHYRDAMGYVSRFISTMSLRPSAIGPLSSLQWTISFGGSTLGRKREEILSVAVSALNRCPYCEVSHTHSLRKAIGDEEADRIVGPICNWDVVLDAATGRSSIDGLDAGDLAMLVFAHKLTTAPAAMAEADVDALRTCGFSDTNVLDIVLLTSWRNFTNRVCSALGVEPEEDQTFSRRLV
jgi:uncharacterized peroxidase-related enzyme